MDICMWFITYDVVCYQNSRRKKSILQWMFLRGRFYYYWNIFTGCRRYYTMNVTMILGLFASIWIERSRRWCFYIQVILFTVTILCGLMKKPLFLCNIIIGDARSFLWMKTEFWIIFKRPVLLMIYKQTQIYLKW